MQHDKAIEHIKEQLPEFSEDAIKLAINAFYEGWRYYLTHPLESKGGILINTLMSIYINPLKVERYLERLKMGNFKRKIKEHTADPEFYRELLKNLDKYERQKEFKHKYERFGERIQSKESDTISETSGQSE